MKRDNRRRMSPGVGYIGAGNKTSVFTRKPKIPFKRMKDIYGNELERLKSGKSDRKKSFKKLTEREKLEIRKRIKIQIRKEQNKNILIGIIAIIITLGLFYSVWNFMISV
jgi:hypothetical protein